MKWYVFVRHILLMIQTRMAKNIFVFIGMGLAVMFIAVLFYCKGLAQAEMERIINSMGANRFAVSLLSKNQAYKHSDFTSADLNAISNTLENIDIQGYQFLPVKANIRGKSLDAQVVAFDTALLEQLQIGVRVGMLRPQWDTITKTVVIGDAVAKQVSEITLAPALGQYISLGRDLYYIIGVIQANEANPLLDFECNRVISVPLEMSTRVGGYEQINALLVEFKHMHLQAAKDFLRTNLQKIGYANIYIREPQIYIKTLEKQSSLFSTVLIVITIVTLISATLSLVNLLRSNVSDRKQEFGLLLTVGASPAQIVVQVWLETIMICLCSAILGLLFATIAAYVLAYIMGLPFVFQWKPYLYGASTAIAIGLIVGYLPAKKIASMTPCELLVHE